MKGKFTLGADAAIAADLWGARKPPPRSASLSYAPRGCLPVYRWMVLLEVDNLAHQESLGHPASYQEIPQSAAKLRPKLPL
jgi:hypothetical protein